MSESTNQPIDLGAVKRGFSNPSLDSQVTFRLLMDALSRPGTVKDLMEAPEPPRGINQATGGIALTLFDFETVVWIDPALRGGETEAWLRFHCGCPLTTDPLEAAFAVVTDISSAPALTDFNQGDAKYPDLSTTVIMEITSMAGGLETPLRGPGINGSMAVSPEGLPAEFWTQMAENGSQFQFGVDLFLTSGSSVMGLPRTVRVGGND